MTKLWLNAVVLLLCGGCMVVEVGDVKVRSFFHTAELPSGSYTVTGTNGIITQLVVEGYKGAGDKEMINASAEAIGALVGAGIKAAK